MWSFLLPLLLSPLSFAVYPADFPEFQNETPIRDDRELVRAVRDKRQIHFIRAANMEVIRLLPDDTQGAKHQRFYVRLSDGQEVSAVYSLESGRDRVPVKVGSRVGLAGEFKWTRFGALIHWLHEDTSNRRPDGYVEISGVRYGKDY